MKRKRLKLIDWRIASVTLLVGVFTVVPIVHVATFAGSFEPSGYEWLGYIYAIGLDLGIATCAWFTRWATTRKASIASYVILVMADGGFNIAYVKPWDRDNMLAAWLYAIFPTLIVSILSFLMARVGKLGEKGNRATLFSALMQRVGLEVEEEKEPSRAELEKIKQQQLDEFVEANTKKKRRAPAQQSAQVLMRDGWRCYYCGRDMRGLETRMIQIDHFVPVTKNGSDEVNNLVVSCDGCNASKNNTMPTPKEVEDFKVYLLKKSQLDMKDKIHLLFESGLVTKQKDIAERLGVSPSYVSNTLRNNGAVKGDAYNAVCQELSTVGLPMIAEGEEEESETTDIELLAPITELERGEAQYAVD